MEIVQSLSSCVLEVFLHEGNQGDFVHLCLSSLIFCFMSVWFYYWINIFRSKNSYWRTKSFPLSLDSLLCKVYMSCRDSLCCRLQRTAVCLLQWSKSKSISWRSREKDVHLPCPTLHNENLAGQKSINPILKQETATFFQ